LVMNPTTVACLDCFLVGIVYTSGMNHWNPSKAAFGDHGNPAS
jgi:hypothetical protein